MQPRLLHPVPVWLKKIDRMFTAIMDENFSEPVGQVRKSQSSIKLYAQLKIGATNSFDPSFGGAEEHSVGYMLFRTSDLRGANFELERGDRVVQLGDGDNKREVDYYIVKVEYVGHYSAAKGATMVKAFFSDRQPANQR
jgi:hypothetical protein